jgi:hypothetical protein
LVHEKNALAGVKDTSRGGAYHNYHFKTAAEPVDLICGPWDKTYGYGATTASAQLEARIIAELRPDESAFTLVRKAIEAKKKNKQTTRMLKWNCGCTIIRAAVKVDATCNACGESFALDS